MPTIAVRALPRTAALACLLLIILCYIHFGAQLAGDAERYIHRGTEVLNLLLGRAGEIHLDERTLLFLLTNLLYAVGDRLLGRHFPTVSIAMNIAAFSVVVFLIYRLWTNNRTGYVGLPSAALSLYLIAGLPAEVLKQNLYAIDSDIPALLFQGAFLYCFTDAILTRKSRSWIWAGALAAVSVIVRPTGIVLVLLLAASYVYRTVIRTSSERPNDKVGLAIVFLLPTALVFVLWPYIFSHREMSWARTLVHSMPWWIVYLYSHGAVIKGMKSTWISSPTTYWDYLHMTVDRFLYYVFPYRPGFSTVHGITNLIYVVFISYAASAGWRRLRRSTHGFFQLAPMMLACSYYFALFHAITIVDAFRYQLPFWPPLWIVAGFGILFRDQEPSSRLLKKAC